MRGALHNAMLHGSKPVTSHRKRRKPESEYDMMTRKHYIEIAKILAVGASAATNESERTIVNNMTDDFIAMLKRDNQSFSAEKFRAYIEKCMWA